MVSPAPRENSWWKIRLLSCHCRSPGGTEKSHLAISLAIAAGGLGKKVRFWWVTELITTLLEAKEERHLLRVRGQIVKLDLLILDELSYVPPAPKAFQPCSSPPH